MNGTLAKEIANHLYKNSKIVTLSAGIAMNYTSSDKKTFPAVLDFCSEKECHTKEKKLTPNTDEGVIVFFKDGSYKSSPHSSITWKATHQLTMHVWCNIENIECAEPNDVIKEVIAKLPKNISSECIKNAIFTDKTIKQEDAYKGYTFSPLYDHSVYPYFSWTVDLLCKSMVNENCNSKLILKKTKC